MLGVIPNNQDKELMKYKKKNNFWDLVRLWVNKGWEISMHGNNHVYDKSTNKKDFFGSKDETKVDLTKDFLLNLLSK